MQPITGDLEIGDSTEYKLYSRTISMKYPGTGIGDGRLTLTYSDVFGRKHAAIFDFTPQRRWELVAYLRDIPEDLADIEKRAASRFSRSSAPESRAATPQGAQGAS
jgi:hypothetical protein